MENKGGKFQVSTLSGSFLLEWNSRDTETGHYCFAGKTLK